MMNQLILGVSLKDEATFENFYAGRNHELIATLKQAIKGVGEQIIYFYGAGGDGRTHLLQAACHEVPRSVYLPLSQLIDLSPEILEELETLDLICVDDVDKIAGRANWEEAFFHLFNRARDAGKCLIVSANVPPKALKITLPDMVSRLTWGIVYQCHPLTDDEKLAALIMRADRWGMTLPEEVGRFILSHCPRHMSTLFAAMDALDKASLAAQRKLTIPFVKTILQI